MIVQLGKAPWESRQTNTLSYKGSGVSSCASSQETNFKNFNQQRFWDGLGAWGQAALHFWWAHNDIGQTLWAPRAGRWILRGTQ